MRLDAADAAGVAALGAEVCRSAFCATTSRAALAVMMLSALRAGERSRNFCTWTASRIWAVFSCLLALLINDAGICGGAAVLGTVVLHIYGAEYVL